MEYLNQLKILQTLTRIESRLDNIEKIISENSKSSKKMEEHIEFVNEVYSVVRKPVSTLLSMCNGKTIELNKNLIKNDI